MFGMPTTTPSNDEILEVLALSVASSDQLCSRLRELFEPAPELPLEKRHADRHPTVVDTASHFSYSHLPEYLQPYSKPCHDVAARMLNELPDSPQLSLGLQKLIEAKDCFVRAANRHVGAIARSDELQAARKDSIVEDAARFDRVSPENPMGVVLPDVDDSAR